VPVIRAAEQLPLLEICQRSKNSLGRRVLARPRPMI